MFPWFFSGQATTGHLQLQVLAEVALGWSDEKLKRKMIRVIITFSCNYRYFLCRFFLGTSLVIHILSFIFKSLSLSLLSCTPILYLCIEPKKIQKARIFSFCFRVFLPTLLSVFNYIFVFPSKRYASPFSLRTHACWQ